jgi:NAD+ synthase (glutamine-hydrolysing)
LAIELGVAELGLEGFKQKLGHIKKIQDCQSVQELSKALITNIYQGTENSSNDTRYSASSLAESLNTTFYDININGLVETYKDLIQGLLEEIFLGKPTIWLQNIQARVRAPSAWLLANINNALLLATSNRSEAAVGYATMDGDTSGSISPIAGIDKHFLRHWLRWLEHTGLDGQVKLSGLNAMNNLQPTAELRPLEAKQIDEEDLMPYDLLNAIETAAFRDKKSPKDCLELMELEFEGIYSKEKLVMSIDRFFRLWSRNQWKRERYAPSFHVDDRNLDPRSWLRFPILSGGFEKELADMHDYANDSKGKQRRSRIGF